MKKKFTEIWSKTDDIVLGYPMVLTVALIAAVSAFVFMEAGHLDYRTEQQLFPVTKLIITACLGISLMFAAKMASQRFGKTLLFETVSVALLALFYFILPEEEKDFTQMYAFIVVPVFVLSHLLVSFVAFVGRQNELNFWQYNKNLFINTFLTGVFTGVLTGGILLAILAVDKLFDFNIEGFRYSQTASFLLIFGSCFIFLLFNERGLFSLEKDTSYPQILIFFTQFVLIPLLLVYLVILYFYSAKILLAWELPKGWVSYLILAYSVVGILAQLLIYPLKNDAAKSWVKVFSKVFYYTLLPLLVLLFIAINTRILQYGYTEPRYFVLLLALWLSAVVLYFIFFRKASIKFIPLSLFVFGLFALVMPYFNAFSVSKRSQKHELIQVLNKNKLLEGNQINFNKKVNDTLAEEVANKFQFLTDRNEAAFLFKFIPKQTELRAAIDNKQHWNVKNLTKAAFKNIEGNAPQTYYNSNDLWLVSALKVIPLTGYDYSVTLGINEEVELPFGKETISNQNTKNASFIVLNSPGKASQSYDLTPFLNEISAPYKTLGRFEVPEISEEFDLGGYHMKIYIKSVSYYKTKQIRSSIPQDITLLIRKK